MDRDGFGAKKAGKKKGRAASVILAVAITVFTLIVIAVIGAWIYYKTAFDRMKLPDTVESIVVSDIFITDSDEPIWGGDSGGEYSSEWDDTDDGTAETRDIGTEPQVIDPGTVVWPDAEGLGDDGLINILIVGQDTSSFKKRSRTDSMILVSVNPNTGGISMISFLRDMYVQIGRGYQDNRLNVAYVYGGFDHLFYVFRQNFGITCDYGVAVNFSSFISIIDMLGGVDVELTQKEVDYLKKTMPGTFPDRYPTPSSVSVSAGKNHLPGDIALTYARARKIDSDFGRTARQRKLMLSIYDSLKSASLGKLIEIVNTVTGISRPGEESWVGLYKISATELIGLMTKLYPLIGNEVSSYSVPPAGTYSYSTVRGMSVIMPNLVKIREKLKTYLPLDENHSIPSATTKKNTTTPPVTEKAPETTSEISDTSGPADETSSDTEQGTVTDIPVTDPAVTESGPDTDPAGNAAAENGTVSETDTAAG